MLYTVIYIQKRQQNTHPTKAFSSYKHSVNTCHVLCIYEKVWLQGRKMYPISCYTWKATHKYDWNASFFVIWHLNYKLRGGVGLE